MRKSYLDDAGRWFSQQGISRDMSRRETAGRRVKDGLQQKGYFGMSSRYIIVGYDRNRAIGADGKLPWEGHMRTDMRHLRELTTDNAIIMGRKTLESIGRALPNRQNIVVTSQPVDVPDVTSVSSLDEAYDAVEPGRKTFVFGGGQIYRAALDAGAIDEIYATEIDTFVLDADTFFPELGKEWREVSCEHHDASDLDAYPFDFVTYRKKV